MSDLTQYPFVVSTIVPAMNEEGNIDEFCRQFDEMQQAAPFKNELVFIDDGSIDNTLDKIKANAAKFSYIKYVEHKHNRGLTEALQSGFTAATGEVYVFYPADLQYKPEDIPKLIKPIAEGADLCTGWKQGHYNKRFVSTVYNWFSRKLFNLKVHDLNSVKAFRKTVVEQIFLRKDWHRYLVVLAANEGFDVAEEKIPLYGRNWGTTKFSIWRIPIGVLDMVAVKFQITFLKKPLLFFGLIGSICFLLGFVGAGFVIGFLGSLFIDVLNLDIVRNQIYVTIFSGVIGFCIGLYSYIYLIKWVTQRNIGKFRFLLIRKI